MARVIRYSEFADDEGLAALAVILAESGRVSNRCEGSCDVASTGGPSSLSTLIGPLALRALGYIVPKVGVPGRPAGAVDVLATIPGFRVALSYDDFSRILGDVGLCHALATGHLAPLDGELFSLRRQLDRVAVANLAIPSLLAKKVAVGLERVVLDVRVWAQGNFGQERAQARSNAARFCRVADQLGIDAVCVLTTAEQPYQPFIGRGESLLALHVALYGDPDLWLGRHIDTCRELAAAHNGVSSALPSSEEMRSVFEANLDAQGASLTAFHERVGLVKAQPTTTMSASADGFVHVDMKALRSTIVSHHASGRFEAAYPDALGVRLLAPPETPVRRGDPIALIRREDPGDSDQLSGDLIAAFSIADVPSSPVPAEVVRT